MLNSGERIPRPLCGGVSEQDTKKVLDGIGFPAALRRGVSILFIDYTFQKQSVGA